MTTKNSKPKKRGRPRLHAKPMELHTIRLAPEHVVAAKTLGHDLSAGVRRAIEIAGKMSP